MQSQQFRILPHSTNFFGFADWRILFSLALITMATACGGGGSFHNITSGGPTLSGNTNITVAVSSSANDQLTEYDLQFLTITLTSAAGKNVNLLTAQQPLEAVHLNGNLEPFITVSVPQDIYTSVSATVGTTAYSCMVLVPPGQPDAGKVSLHSFFPAMGPKVTINMPAPITVSGQNMTLLLNMDVSDSASFSCSDSSLPFMSTPTFNLSTVTFAAQPTNAANGKVVALNGAVTNLDTTNSKFTFSIPEGLIGTRTLDVKFDSNTVFQGTGTLSTVSTSQFADIDGAIQGDGSLLATRVEVKDSSALNLFSGPVVTVVPNVTALNMQGRLQQGQSLAMPPILFIDITSVNYGSAVSRFLDRLQTFWIYLLWPLSLRITWFPARTLIRKCSKLVQQILSP